MLHFGTRLMLYNASFRKLTLRLFPNISYCYIQENIFILYRQAVNKCIISLSEKILIAQFFLCWTVKNNIKRIIPRFQLIASDYLVCKRWRIKVFVTLKQGDVMKKQSVKARTRNATFCYHIGYKGLRVLWSKTR